MFTVVQLPMEVALPIFCDCKQSFPAMNHGILRFLSMCWDVPQRKKTGRTSRKLYEMICSVDLTLQEGSQLVTLQPFLKNNNLENTG